MIKDPKKKTSNTLNQPHPKSGVNRQQSRQNGGKIKKG